MACKYKVKECKCSSIPLERTGTGPVDLFFITEFPGKVEVKEKKFLTGFHGKFFREILRVLKTKINFSYAISGVTRSESKPQTLIHYSPEVRACVNNLEAEIEKCQPKVIVVLGDLPYSLFSKHNALPKHGARVEDGRLRTMNVFGKKYPVMFCQHTTWYVHNESCAVGFLYENIRKALDYCINKINPNIPNNFESVTLRSLKEVKKVLSELAKTKNFTTVDTEGCNLYRVYGNKLLSVQLSCDGKVGYLIPYLHKDSPFLDKIPELKKLLIDFFYSGKTNTKGYVFVNTKYDYHQFFRELKRFSFNAPVIDASFGQYSLDENWVRVHSFPKQKGAYSLFTMAYKRGFKFYSDTDSKEKRTILDKIPLKEWEQYAAADVVAPWHIFNRQIQEAERTDYREGFLFLNCIYQNHLVRCLTYAEHCGLSMNAKKVRALRKSDSVIASGIKDVINRFYALPSVQEANARLSKGKTGMASGLAGEVRTWSPSSPKHRELLYFDVMGLDPVNEDDDGDNSHTGKSFQKNYAGIDEVDLLVEFMSFDKMMSGFIKPMTAYLDKTSPDGSIDMYTDNKARTNFYPFAVTGRMRSSNPNTQQRPAGRSAAAKEILSMYEPKKDRIVIKLDYKTFEVMGSGFLSGDKVMIKSFQDMNKLKVAFRKKPTVFAEDGYEVQKLSLKETRKALKKKKQEVLDSKGKSSKKDYRKAKDDFRKELAAYRAELEKLENLKETDPIALSKLYVTLMTDSHRKFAALFFRKDVVSVTKTQRQQAKTLVFGCFPGDAIVSTAWGGERIGKLQGSPCVVSLKGELKNSGGVVSQGVQKVYEVRTTRNYLEATPDHEVLCVTKNATLKKVKLVDLKLAMAVVRQRGEFGYSTPYLGNKKMSVEDVEALGLFTSDGSFGFYKNTSNYRIFHGSCTKEELNKTLNFVRKYSGRNPAVNTHIARKGSKILNSTLKKNGKKFSSFLLNCKKLYLELKGLGLIGNQHTRRVPDIILNSKPEYIAAYIRGVFDGDGGIRKSSGKMMQVFLNSCNRKLLSDIAYLLDLFGIDCRIYGRNHFELIITGSQAIKKYGTLIGFGTKRKQDRLVKYLKVIKGLSRVSGPKVEYPFSLSDLRAMYTIRAKCGNFRNRDIFYKGVHIPALPKSLKILLNNLYSYKEAFLILGMKDQFECLEVLASDGCNVSLVTKGPKYAGEKEVFDVVNVDDHHMWCANGSIVSNCLYGMSLASIAKSLKITEDEAKKLFATYMKSFPYAAKWLEASKKFARKHYYVQSPLGRRRRLWGHLRLDKTVSGKMDRYAGNTVIQGVCSDDNLIGGSLCIHAIEAHGKLKYQVPDEDCWELTNVIHDSCEFEIPLRDVYYFIKEMEKVFTEYLAMYLRSVFEFNIEIPLEVDFTVGTNYGNTRDWDGSDEDLVSCVKWLCEETAKRDKTEVMNYKKVVKSPLYKEFKEGYVLDVIKGVARDDIKSAKAIGIYR